MQKKNHYIKRVSRENGESYLHCHAKKDIFSLIDKILCEGTEPTECVYEMLNEDDAGVNYQVTLPLTLNEPCKFFIILKNKTKIRVWQPWKNLVASNIPDCFYFTHHYFNLSFNPDAAQIIKRKTPSANSIQPTLTKLNFKNDKVYLSGYLFVAQQSKVLSETVSLQIVKFREEKKQYSFNVVTSPVDNQERIFKRFSKFYYKEYWRQEVTNFSCVINLEDIKFEKGFFKLFIKYNGCLVDIKNHHNKLGKKDFCYQVQLPLFKKVFFVPYCDDIVNTWRLDIYHFNLIERVQLSRLFRKYSKKLRPEKDSNTWLIGEYQNTARDNGMHFFNFLRKVHPKINAYYVIYGDSPDRKNIKSGHVISYGSYKHFALSAKAKVLVFSHAANFLVPKIDRITAYKNKYQAYHTIFIQHGIIATTALALIYRKKLREYDRFVVSSSFEKNIIHRHLGYDKENIVITGLARWDNLLNISTKTTDILIMPTWRNDLNNVSIDVFKQSVYFKFWKALLSDKSFIDFIQKKRITVKFFLHFALSRFADCFDLPKEIIQVNKEDVQALLGSCGLLVTDYSSVAFDVLLQNKPVIFAPFDYDDMTYMRKGTSFVDYEKDLPGPVCYDVKSTLQNLKKYVKNGYIIEPKFHERREEFFKYIDNYNCDRVFSEINKLISYHSLDKR